MKAVEFPEMNCKFAEHQDEYLTLPAHKQSDGDGIVISCWEFSFWERIKILFGKKLWLMQMTFGQLLQPQLPTLDKPFEGDGDDGKRQQL